MAENEETYSYSSLRQEYRSSLREIDLLGETLTNMGTKRVMVICGQNVLHKSDVVHRTEEALGALVVGRFDGVVDHTPVDVVEKGRDAAFECEPDTLVSVGGGSAAVTARAVALLMSTDHQLEDYRVRFEPPDTYIQPDFPLPDVKVRNISVATTIGYSETMHRGGGVTSRDRTKKFFLAGDGRTAQQLICIDGFALASTPQSIQTNTTLSQLRNAIECVTSAKSNPLGEAYGLQSIRLFNRELLLGWHHEPHQLLRIKGASYLAALAVGVTRAIGLSTAIGHQVGAICHAGHGEIHAVLLPHTIRFSAVESAEKLRLVAQSLEIDLANMSPSYVANAVAERIESVCATLGTPRRLRDIGVSKDSFDAIAIATLSDIQIGGSPRTVGKEEVLEVLEQAW